MAAVVFTAETVVHDWPLCTAPNCGARVNPLSQQWARTRRCKAHEIDPNRQVRATGKATNNRRFR